MATADTTGTSAMTVVAVTDMAAAAAAVTLTGMSLLTGFLSTSLPSFVDMVRFYQILGVRNYDDSVRLLSAKHY